MIKYDVGTYQKMFDKINGDFAVTDICIAQCTGCMCNCRCSCSGRITMDDVDWDSI